MSRFKIGDKVIVTQYADDEERWECENNPNLCYKVGQRFTIKEVAEWGVVWGSKDKGLFEHCIELVHLYKTPLYKAMQEEE